MRDQCQLRGVFLMVYIMLLYKSIIKWISSLPSTIKLDFIVLGSEEEEQLGRTHERHSIDYAAYRGSITAGVTIQEQCN